MGDGDVNFPKFTPMPSLAHELGVMFGFIAACLFTMGLYFVLWQKAQRCAANKDKARRDSLRARGFHHEKGGIHEKMMSRFAARLPPPPSRPPTATPSSPLSLRNGRAAELAAAGRARMARSMSPALRATTSSSTTGTSAIEVYRTRTPPPSPHPLEITMTANFVNGGGAFAREIF
jgi:hypothetical protein